MHHPVLELHQPVNPLTINPFALAIPEQRPNPTIAVSRMLLDQLVNAFNQRSIRVGLGFGRSRIKA
jgi:hypothetical protein